MNYDPDFQADYPARRAKEENWAASTRNQSHKRAIKRGGNNYLLKLVDPTWLRPLKNETTFCTRLTPIEMLTKLTKESGGLERSTPSTYSSPSRNCCSKTPAYQSN